MALLDTRFYIEGQQFEVLETHKRIADKSFNKDISKQRETNQLQAKQVVDSNS